MVQDDKRWWAACKSEMIDLVASSGPGQDTGEELGSLGQQALGSAANQDIQDDRC